MNEITSKKGKLPASEGEAGGNKPPLFTQDLWFYRIALISLSIVAVGGMIAAVSLSLLDKEIPELIKNLSSASVGALAGLLAGVRSAK